MTSSRSRLPEAALLWLPLLVLVGGLAVVWTGIAMAVDVNRSAGLFPGRVTDVRGASIAYVRYTGPDGVTSTEAFEHHQGREIRSGRQVQIRVWPDERRAELDPGDEHTPVIVAGSLLTLLGAGGTVLVFMWHRGVRLDVTVRKWRKRVDVWLWGLSRWL